MSPVFLVWRRVRARALSFPAVRRARAHTRAQKTRTSTLTAVNVVAARLCFPLALFGEERQEDFEGRRGSVVSLQAGGVGSEPTAVR